MSERGVMWILGGVISAVTLSVLFLRWLRKSEDENKSSFDELVAHVAAESLGKRLGTDEEAIRKALLDEGPDRSLRGRIEAAVDRIRMIFQRAGQPGRVLLRVEVLYRDREVHATTVEMPWESVPEEVRADLLRGGRRKVEWVHEMSSAA